jgi:hypothetical protein
LEWNSPYPYARGGKDILTFRSNREADIAVQTGFEE